MRGLEKCVATMRKGETCELICRSEYAYGAEGWLPDVPPGASVRFELELISFVAPKKERSELTPRCVKFGLGLALPASTLPPPAQAPVAPLLLTRTRATPVAAASASRRRGASSARGRASSLVASGSRHR